MTIPFSHTSLATAHFEQARLRTPKADDAWVTQLSGRRRILLDTMSHDGLADAMHLADQFLPKTPDGSADVSVVLVARHVATPLCLNEELWRLYGPRLAALAGSWGRPDASARTALDALARRGLHLAVCALSITRLASAVEPVNARTQALVAAEFGANLVPNGRLVPSGSTTVALAGCSGFTIVSA
jgi:hypothetical protein